MSDDVLLELFSDDDDDPAESERLALSLRQELLEIPEVETVKSAKTGPAPPGARGLDISALGALLVTVKPTVELLGRVIGAVQSWLDRGGRATSQTMKVTINGQSIELKATKQQQAEIVARYLRAVAESQPK